MFGENKKAKIFKVFFIFYTQGINQGIENELVMFWHFDKRSLPLKQLCFSKEYCKDFKSAVNFSHLLIRGLIKELKT